MSIRNMNIREIQGHIHDIALNHGWWDDAPKEMGYIDPRWVVPERLCLIHQEISEALDELRSGHAPHEIYYGEDGKPEGFPIECADAVIRLMDVLAAYGVDLGEAIEIKSKYNETRAFKHGRSF